MAHFVDYTLQNWIDGNGDWLNFNNMFEINDVREENRLIRKFYDLIGLNSY